MNLAENPRNIWAVGRNYAAHAKELGNAVPGAGDQPIFFLKSGNCLVQGSKIPWAKSAQSIHFEIEMIVRLGKNLQPIDCALALDLTDRKSQNELKSKGQPWTLAKSFSHSCPVAPWLGPKIFQEFSQLSFGLKVNGVERQKGKTSDMLFSLPDLLAELIKNFPVQEGDLFLTGTPEGVGELKPHDQLQAWVRDATGTCLCQHDWVMIP